MIAIGLVLPVFISSYNTKIFLFLANELPYMPVPLLEPVLFENVNTFIESVTYHFLVTGVLIIS